MKGGSVKGLVLCIVAVAAACAAAEPAAAPPAPPAPAVLLSQERTAYFVGEKVLLSVPSPSGKAPVQVEFVAPDGRLTIYRGKPGMLVLDTSLLAPGEYTVAVNGAAAACPPLFIVPVERRSAASFQDECFFGPEPSYTAQEHKDPALKAAKLNSYREGAAKLLRETGLTATMGMMGAGSRFNPMLDVAARTGVMHFVNPDTRPTSFCSPHVDPVELDGMTQRMLFMAGADGRYPNFGGFCFGFDTGGFQPGARRMLLVYWNWGQAKDALRAYLDHENEVLTGEFKRRTGCDWVTPEEYIAYTLSIQRPDMAPVIDLPTQRYMEAIAPYMKPVPADQREAFEKRLDAWSAYLMGIYGESYAYFTGQMRPLDPTLRYTSSVQIDHGPVMQGVYLPPAYRVLDFRYQSTWNDQVGAPDYAYQPLFTAAMLDMERPDRTPVWISNSHAFAHGKSPFAGKLTRVAAHILPHGGSGLGFAFEGFSTLLGGMAETGTWAKGRGTALEYDVTAGREFIERFAALALEGRGGYGVGVLFSKTQFGRQYVVQAFGTPQFRTLVSLTRLGYTPVYLTEDDVAERRFRGVPTIAVVGQTVPLPAPVREGLDAFVAGGGRIIADGSTTADLPPAVRMDIAMPLRNYPGKPHNWAVQNGPAEFLFADEHRELAPALEQALAGRGHALLRAERGAATELTLAQIDGGADAAYVLAVNDSFVRSQADWHVIRENVLPRDERVQGFLYDLTDEAALGQVRPIPCELEETTARVYGVLSREPGPADLRCRQRLTAGEELPISVRFADAAGKRLAAVVPFRLDVSKPDGTPFFGGYRSTDREGDFTIALRVPLNAPAGAWQVSVRCQLDGQVTALPVEVKAAKARPLAEAYDQGIVVREKNLIEKTLARGATVMLPLFSKQGELADVAETIRAKLRAKGVTVDVVADPPLADYYLAYDPTPEQRAANERVDKGEAIGRIKRQTVHGNDWFGGQSGSQCARPLILLDLAGTADNELAEALDRSSLLWPQAGALGPGKGLAVVQAVPWAFGPHADTIVIQAADADGLKAAAERLTRLPEDFLTASVRDARSRLMRELYVGGRPDRPEARGLTAKGLTTASRPQPFRIRFGDAKPYPPDQQPQMNVPFERRPVSPPATVAAAELDGRLRSTKGYVLSWVFGDWKSDMRFCDAYLVEVDMKQAGPLEIAVDGVFRYVDRAPCYAPQWEDALALRTRYLPKDRVPPSFDVLVDGRPAGKLDKLVTGERDVQLELYASSAAQKPRFQKEEVVVEIGGTVQVPAGRHTILLDYHNIVDGILQRVRLGMSKADAEAAEQKAKDAQQPKH